MNKFIKNLLNENSVSNELRELIKDNYRNVIEDDLENAFDFTPTFKYGGSLAKHTANKGSADIDLLCYLPSTSIMSVKDVYEKTSKILKTKGYHVVEKNSAIHVTGKNDEIFQFTIDVVPGKYIDNESRDVFLWKSREQVRMKTNPVLHLEKIRSSNSNEVIRFFKLIRDYKKIKFKSFYLKLFIIDIVEPFYIDTDLLQDKIMKVLYNLDSIGVKKVI